MKEDSMLIVGSLLSVLFASVHIADDVVRGMSPGGLGNLLAVLICVIWLYGTLLLAGRRSGYITVLVLSVLVLGVLVIHMQGPGIGFGTHRSNGLIFVWTLFGLGISALFSAILCVRGLLRLRRLPS